MTKILPPAYLVAAIVLMIAVHVLIPLSVVIPFAWRFIGLLPLAVGIGLNIVADRQFKNLNTTVKPFQASRALVTDGVFAWSRNPMYLGMVLVVSGIAVLEGSLSPWVVVVAFAVLLDRTFIGHEEHLLEETFGAQFRQYRNDVRKWL